MSRIASPLLKLSREVTSGETAALQPSWLGSDLVVADDPTDRWNLWRVDPDGNRSAIAPADADTGEPGATDPDPSGAAS